MFSIDNYRRQNMYLTVLEFILAVKVIKFF